MRVRSSIILLSSRRGYIYLFSHSVEQTQHAIHLVTCMPLFSSSSDSPFFSCSFSFFFRFIFSLLLPPSPSFPRHESPCIVFVSTFLRLSLFPRCHRANLQLQSGPPALLTFLFLSFLLLTFFQLSPSSSPSLLLTNVSLFYLSSLARLHRLSLAYVHVTFCT